MSDDRWGACWRCTPFDGSVLRRCRQEAGMTQAEVAGRLGVGVPHVSKIERDRENPSPELRFQIALLFGMDAETFLRSADQGKS